ncbi:class I SAM-dependent methyltransferase [Microbacterium aurum]|uniref:class I SAM-dependent methyltransferase n=1 Tax=Microbacterium aurum TaxID=36805 RepID=UPI0009FC4182|nr:methyltransferase domain-containing protein [Microbacterium aurum]MBM7826135.1 SAM-dependent methyltransferase [Microbacterium aurum]
MREAHVLSGASYDSSGIDLAPEFVDHARATYPDATFERGDIDAIGERDGSLGGILAWFSTIHHEPERIHVPLTEFARVLRPGGTLLLGYFDGAAIEPFDHAVVRAYRWPAGELSAALGAAGFDIVETHRRTERGHRDVGALLAERRAS